MISDVEANDIIDWGRSQGFTQQQVLSLLEARDNELKEAKAKAEAQAKADAQTKTAEVEVETEEVKPYEFKFTAEKKEKPGDLLLTKEAKKEREEKQNKVQKQKDFIEKSVGKDESALAAKLQQNPDYPGLTAKDKGGWNPEMEIQLPIGGTISVDPDNKDEWTAAMNRVNEFYNNVDTEDSKYLNRLSSIQFDDDDSFNQIWSDLGYNLDTKGSNFISEIVLTGPDGQLIDLSETKEKYDLPGDGIVLTPIDLTKAYLHDNATDEEVQKIVRKGLDAENEEYLNKEKSRKEYLNSNEFKQQSRNNLFLGGYTDYILDNLDNLDVSESTRNTFESELGNILGEGLSMSLPTGAMYSEAHLEQQEPQDFHKKMLDIGSILNKLPDNIPNPDFQKNQPVTKDNAETIPNPDKKAIKDLFEKTIEKEDGSVISPMQESIKKQLHEEELEIINNVVRSETDQKIREGYRDLIEIGSEVRQRQLTKDLLGIDAKTGLPLTEEKIQELKEKDPERVVLSKQHIDKKVELFKAEVDKSIKTYETNIKALAKEANSKGVSVSMDEQGNFLVRGDDNQTVDYYKKQFNILKTNSDNKIIDFTETSEQYKNDYLNWQNRYSETLEIVDQTTRESDIWKMAGIEFSNGFKRMGHAAVGFFDHEKATEWKKNIEEGVSIGLEKKLDYRTAYKTGQKGRFVFRENAAQGANTIVAMVGTAATGGIFGATSLAARATAPVIFGLYSGSDAYLGYTIDEQAAEKAKIQLKELIKNKSQMDLGDFTKTKQNLEAIIRHGTMTKTEKFVSSASKGVIEAGIMAAVGTVPNTLAIVKRMQQMPGTQMADKILRSNLKAFTHGFVGVGGKQLLYEVIEETGIEGLSVVSDGLWLGRDMNFDTIDDVAVSTIVSAGSTTGTFAAYSTIVEQMQTAPYRQDVKERVERLGKLEIELSREDLTKEMKDIYTDQYKAQVEELVGIHTGLEVDAIAIGAKNTKALLKAGIEEKYLNALAGANPTDDRATIEEKRKSYIESLDKQEAQSYTDKIKAIEELREKITGDINYDGVAQRTFGEKGKYYENKLKNDPAYKKADQRGKLIMILNAVRQDKINDNVKMGKQSPNVTKAVEMQIYGMPFSETGRKNRKRREEEALYTTFAENLLIDQRQAFIQADKGNLNAANLLNTEQLSKLQIVETKDVDKMKEAVWESETLTEAEKKGIVHAIENGSAKGVIIDNKYIVQDKDAAEANLKRGDLLQGTVMAHEISHFIDDHSFKSVEEKSDYTNKLHGFVSKNSPAVHELALERVDGLTDATGKSLHDPKKSFEDQALQYKDEYTKAVQDLLIRDDFAIEYADFKKKSGKGIINRIQGIRGKDFKIYTEDNAAAWMVDFIDNFRKGKLSPLAKRKMKAAEGISVAESGYAMSSVVERAKQNLSEVQQEDTYDPNSPAILSELPGMIDAQINNYFARRPKLTANFGKDQLKQAKEELAAEIFGRLYTPAKKTGKSDMNAFDGRGTLYGYLNGRIKFRMLDTFEQNPTIVPDHTKKEINEAREDLIKELADDLTKIQNQELDQPRNKTNVLKIGKVADKSDNIIETVKVKEGDTHVEVTDVKNVNGNTGKVAEIIFGVPAKKILDRNEKGKPISANLTYAKKFVDGIPEASEAGNIQNFYTTGDSMEKTIRTLPEFNITSNDADINELGENIQVSPTVKGRSLGLKNRLIDFFYEPYIDPKATSKDADTRAESITNPKGRSRGKTTQTQVYRLKPEFRGKTISTETINKAKEAAGITPRLELNKYDRTIGQFLKGLALHTAKQSTLSAAQRKLEAAKAEKQQIADITAAQSRYAFSAEGKVDLDKDTKNLEKRLNKSDIIKEDAENIDIDFIDLLNRGNLNKTLNLHGHAPQLTLDSETNIDLHFEEAIQIKNILGQELAHRGIYYNSSRAVPKSLRNKEIFIERLGKSMTVLEYYILKVNDVFPKGDTTTYGKQLKGPASKYKKGKTYKTLYGENAEDFKSALTEGRPYHGKGKDQVKMTIPEINEMHISMGKQLWKRINDDIKEGLRKGDNTRARKWANYLSLATDVATHPHRQWAEFIAWSMNPVGSNPKGDTNSKSKGYKVYEWEHAMQSAKSINYLMHSILGGYNFDNAFALIRENYKLIALDNYDDKVKLKGAKRTHSMGDNWTVIDGFWKRYFDQVVAAIEEGINPQGIMTIYGETMGDYYGINNKGEQDILLPGHSENYKFSKAVNQSRIPSETKGMSAWDFDDTVARTKSGVRYTMPNPTGVPQPGRKVIFLAGGAGSGKSNVVKQLGLVDQGFKVVNSDISLEWLKKNSGLPADMKDLTPKQLSQLGKLQWEARKIAARKQMKFQGQGDGIVVDGTGGSMKVMEKQVQEFKDKGYDVQMLFVETSLETALARNKARKERTLKNIIVIKNHEAVQNNKEGFRTLFGDNFAEVKTDNLKIGDPMPSNLVNKLDKFTKGHIKGRLTAEEFAERGASILEQGGEFDFKEFDVVTKGEKGPLFGKAMDRAKKYGLKDNYILTARPHAAKKPIYEFLKSQGLEIPLDNIITLENSTSEAKALWIAEKVGEGYNDIYFADDALQNVQAVDNMMNQFDIKSKVQQAKIQFSKGANKEFNDMLEGTKGLPSEYKISQAKARQRGKKVGRFKLWIPPSADDFAGLLQMFQGKGEQGMKDAAWLKEHLLDPFARGDRSLNGARQRTAEEFKALRKKFPEVSKKLRKVIPTGDYTFGDAIRVYLWDKNGIEIPGLSKTDQAAMVELVKGDPELQAFSDVLGVLSRKEDGYITPDEYWMTKDIVADITEDGIIGDGRKDHLAEWIENKDLIFTPENLNKIEFLYGSNFREALEDILYRMENGSNRPTGSNRIVNNFLNWLNGGISVVMNWNTRSALLQTLSTVNFINWGDNNMLAAAKAFANQKQFWTDFAYIFNSDMLRQRRAGLKTTIESNELMSEVEGAVNPVRAAIRYLLRVGFTPTKIADSFAIAMGGSSFYRNRIKTYEKQGYSTAEAEAKAWLDFQETAEEAQQSSRPDRISMQQASTLGRIILAFQNTPMQYMRMSKKEVLDLVNGRYVGMTGENSVASKVGKILYYTAIQNLIFYTMQTALFAAMYSDDEDDEEFFTKKREMVVNNMGDGILRGLGVGGAVVSTIKNIILKYIANKDSKMYDESVLLMEGLKLSPPLSIKARQLLSADKTMRYNRDVIKEMETFDIDNPMWNATFNVVEMATNAPLSRMESKYKNVRDALNNEYELWQRIAFMLGYNKWSLGLKDKEIEEIKKEIKAIKTFERKKKAQEKKQKEQAEAQAKVNKKIEKEKELQEKGVLTDPKCRHVSSKGERCSISVAKAGDLCTVHEEKPQRVDGKKVQCKKVKQDGKRCKMQTSNKSGYCYYHD